MSETLKVTVNRGNGYVVISTDGYINNIGGEKVAEECHRLIQEGFRHVILNLEKSHVINSIGVSILIEVIERVQEIGGTLSFCGLTPTIAKTFRIMRLTDAAGVYEDEAAAVAAVPS